MKEIKLFVLVDAHFGTILDAKEYKGKPVTLTSPYWEEFEHIKKDMHINDMLDMYKTDKYYIHHKNMLVNDSFNDSMIDLNILTKEFRIYHESLLERFDLINGFEREKVRQKNAEEKRLNAIESWNKHHESDDSNDEDYYSRPRRRKTKAEIEAEHDLYTC